MVIVIAGLAMAMCGAVLRILDGRQGALPLAMSIVAVALVTVALLGALKRFILLR